MSQSRWKYWIEDGVAHIREDDMPPMHNIKAQLVSPLEISIAPIMNPDYYEFKTEIYRVTGKKEVLVVQREGREKYR